MFFETQRLDMPHVRKQEFGDFLEKGKLGSIFNREDSFARRSTFLPDKPSKEGGYPLKSFWRDGSLLAATRRKQMLKSQEQRVRSQQMRRKEIFESQELKIKKIKHMVKDFNIEREDLVNMDNLR